MTAWSLDHARKTYSIPHWSEGYFDVDAAGRITVAPLGPQGPSIPLPEVIDKAKAQGAKLPLLVRFPDILGDRLRKLQGAFAQSMTDWDCRRLYRGVSDQGQPAPGRRRHAGRTGEGLDWTAGSKPADGSARLEQPGGLIVCNGYKDRGTSASP
jgi:arginine decarboxylase